MRRGSPSDDLRPGRSIGERRWRRLLFGAVRSDQPGAMPAGLVLVVVVGGLLLATFLNADATLRKSKARGGEGIRQEVAQRVADVSDFLHISGPRRWADEAMGRSVGETKDVSQLVAEKQAAEEAQGTTDTTVAGPPVLRKPTLDDPLKLWVGGDSVGGSFGVQMQPISASTGLFDSTLDFTVGTGLIRPDYYDWPGHFANDVLPTDPDVIVCMFGANDDQNLEFPDGRVVDKYTPEWYAEYRRRVGATMDLLESPTNDRLVVWVGADPAGPGSNISNQDDINWIYWTEAQKRPWVTYVDTWALLGGPDQTFAKEVLYADGQMRGPYQKDNLHLSTWGAQRLSWGTMAHIGRFIDLSDSKVPNPPPSESAPPDVQERDPLPKPADMPDGV